MRTVFRHCILVNFAIRPEALSKRLPSHVRPDVHEGWSFLSIIIAEMEKMRPAFLPAGLGITFSQVVYRAVVRCGDERGVHFLRSDADNGLMVRAGNAVTFFRFHHSDITWSFADESIRFSLRPRNGEAAGINAHYDLRAGGTTMPTSSRFSSLTQAQGFLTELYVAFGGAYSDGMIDAVRIRRNIWQSVVIPDRIGTYEAMSSGLLFGPGEAELDSCFYVEQMNYHWSRGTKVRAS